ncbi:MAG: DNA translocase FtsK [Defluviitaleaceae bacterium]|nr:DNA translocase FtsK [Defluviitaleaceae bacterium]
MPRKTSTDKKPTPKPAPRPKKPTEPPPPPPQDDSLYNEVKYLAVAAVGILLLLAIFLNDSMGPVGGTLRSLLVGFFGVGAFALPVVILAVAVCKLILREFRVPVVKIVAAYWVSLSLLHIFIFAIPGRRDNSINIFKDVYEAKTGGGVFGLIIGGSTYSLFGFGAIIALIAALIILVTLISRRSFVQFVGTFAKRVHHYYEDSRQYEQSYEQSYDYEDEEGYEPRDNVIVLREQNRSDSIDIVPMKEKPKPAVGILLVGESADGKPSKRRESPLFAERMPVSEAVGRQTSLPLITPRASVAKQDEYEEPAHEEQPHEAPYYNEPPYEDGYEEPYEDEPVILPLQQNDFVEPVVRGLVENSQETEPLYEDEIDDEEYTPAPAPARNVAPISFGITYENYQMPSINLLAKNERAIISAESRTHVLENSRILEETLRSFRIEARVIEVSVGPTVTRYDLSPGPGVKVSSISNLSNDLALSLAAQGLRIEAPVPGKSAVGIEIPNKEPQGVFLREILEDERFINYPSKLAFAVGKDIAGSPIITDVARMPHLLIAGATGSGKSVCINTLIASLLYKARPDEVKLLMIDPKVVELNVYNGIPHLLIPVVTDPKKASGALSWAVNEMENRYNMFAETGCRDLKGYNKVMADEESEELPLIVIIIDELADLMMTCKGEVEESICRLAQKARAAGIHLILATQRPSVDVITGLIKANIPSRLAFAVSSGTDSRTVLDMYGAEKLLGKGDMLFLPMGQSKPLRVQGGFISDKEVENLVAFLKAQAPVVHSVEEIQRVTMPGKVVLEGELDEFFHDAVDFLLAKGKGSTSMLQRQFRIGYNRASRLMDDLEARGIVGPEDGVKPRKVTITREEFRELYG